MNYTLSFVVLILIFSCVSKSAVSVDREDQQPFDLHRDNDSVEVIRLGTGTHFKFKGLAIDDTGSAAYLGSWDKKEIVSVSLRDRTYEILKTKYSGRLNGMDCYLKNGFGYALMNEVDDSPTAMPISVLLVFDPVNRKLIRAYEAKGIGGRNHFNHVVVDDEGVAYISNTLKSSIFTVNTKDADDVLKKLIEHEDLSWVHGIDLSPDGTRLFATSYDGGIKFLDLKSLTFTNYKDIRTAGDDGLKYDHGYLYGVGKNSIKRYQLDEALSKVVKTDTILANHSYFNDPRCLHIANGYLYCLANIEFEPVVFNAKQSRETPLTDTYLIKIKLPN